MDSKVVAPVGTKVPFAATASTLASGAIPRTVHWYSSAGGSASPWALRSGRRVVVPAVTMAKLGDPVLLPVKSTTWTPPARADQRKSVVVSTPLVAGAGSVGSAGLGSVSVALVVPGATPASDPRMFTDPLTSAAIALTRMLMPENESTTTEKPVAAAWSWPTGKNAPSANVTSARR